MILDSNAMFSDAQAITASAVSAKTIDLGAGRDAGGGRPLEVLVQVVEDFATLTSLTVGLQTDDDPAFGGAVTLQRTDAIPAAALKAGYRFALSTLPRGCRRYLRLSYTVGGGNATAGKLTAALVLDRQTNGI